MSDVIGINSAGQFDSGPVVISTSGTRQKIGRLQTFGKGVTMKIKVTGNTIGHIYLTQSAMIDDPDPVDLCVDDTGFNAPAIADEQYCMPAMALPLAVNSVYEVRVNGKQAELTLWASTAASGAAAAIEWSGTVDR